MNWDDRVQQARQTVLVEYLRQNNEPLKRIGQWWYIEGCDSLRIQGNKWYRNSQCHGGNSIDFLVVYYGLSPKEAIERLTQDTGCPSVKENCGAGRAGESSALLAHATGVKEKNIKTRAGFDFNAIATA